MGLQGPKMSKHHKIQKIFFKIIMNAASLFSSLPPLSTCEERITKIQVSGNKGLAWVVDEKAGEAVSRIIGEAEP